MSENIFTTFGLRNELVEVLKELQFTQLTPIQEQSIPLLLKNKDVVGQAKTGSGKTAAYGLPILNTVDTSHKNLQALILCPTRELALQVATELRKFGRKIPGLHIATLIGGQKGKEQREALDNGAQIAIATPGRISDFISKDLIDIDDIQTVVLDEADKMLEMGFAAELKIILRSLSPERQTVLFSATFPETIEGLSRKYQKNATHLVIEDEEKNDITQLAFETSAKEKLQTLTRCIQQYPVERTLIFVNMKATANDICAHLKELGAIVETLHGDLDQREREKVMTTFANKSTRILVATDIAARGLDIENLEMVINYDLPRDSETYLHRIGRTGRAGAKGLAITLIDPRDTVELVPFEEITQGKFERPTLGFKNQFGLVPEVKMPLMETLLISAGRKDKLRAGDILGSLTKDAGLNSSQIGKIDIKDNHSFVAINFSMVQKAFEHLKNGRIKGKRYPVKHLK